MYEAWNLGQWLHYVRRIFLLHSSKFFRNYDISYGFDTYKSDHTDPHDTEKSFNPAPMMAHVRLEVKCQIVSSIISKTGFTFSIEVISYLFPIFENSLRVFGLKKFNFVLKLNICVQLQQKNMYLFIAFERMDRYYYNDYEVDENCPICLEPLKVEKEPYTGGRNYCSWIEPHKVVHCKCEHIFHFKCIRQWSVF
jgi:hypothetical protein